MKFLLDKYISRPMIVNAVRVTPENYEDIRKLTDVEPTEQQDGFTFKTIHGDRAVARFGDWIVAERAAGRYYPVKNDIFEEKYRPYLTRLTEGAINDAVH